MHGASGGDRTHDLRFTKPLLYRLSYASNAVIIAAILSSSNGRAHSIPASRANAMEEPLGRVPWATKFIIDIAHG
jgi:hypothetical protein